MDIFCGSLSKSKSIRACARTWLGIISSAAGWLSTAVGTFANQFTHRWSTGRIRRRRRVRLRREWDSRSRRTGQDPRSRHLRKWCILPLRKLHTREGSICVWDTQEVQHESNTQLDGCQSGARGKRGLDKRTSTDGTTVLPPQTRTGGEALTRDRQPPSYRRRCPRARCCMSALGVHPAESRVYEFSLISKSRGYRATWLVRVLNRIQQAVRTYGTRVGDSDYTPKAPAF